MAAPVTIRGQRICMDDSREAGPVFSCFLQSHSAAFTYPFFEVGPQGFVLCSLDIGDAYLTVDQKVPALVNYTSVDVDRVEYALGKVLPGQRD